jgi:hypothetical protein
MQATPVGCRLAWTMISNIGGRGIEDFARQLGLQCAPRRAAVHRDDQPPEPLRIAMLVWHVLSQIFTGRHFGGQSECKQREPFGLSCGPEESSAFFDAESLHLSSLDSGRSSPKHGSSASIPHTMRRPPEFIGDLRGATDRSLSDRLRPEPTFVRSIVAESFRAIAERICLLGRGTTSSPKLDGRRARQ